MKYNSPHSTAAFGPVANYWEQGVDCSRLSKERLARAQEAIRYAGLGAVLCFNFDNIRYVTATHIGEEARDKFFRYALCPAQGRPFLWNPAPPAKRTSSPWISDNVAAPITTMQGAIPPSMNVQHDFAKQIKKALVHNGIANEPLGIDMMEIGMQRALEAEGVEVVDGQQALLDAREIKTPDEVELLKMAAAMVNATYVDIAKAIRPGTKENELVAIANDRLFRMGCERVECVNSVSGRRGRPHSHTFSDRMIQPGDMIRIGKLDLVMGDRAEVETRLRAELRRFNPSAEIGLVDWAPSAVAGLLSEKGFDAADPKADPRSRLNAEAHAESAHMHDEFCNHDHHDRHLHAKSIESFVLTREAPLSREELQFLLEGIGQNLGSGLLRVKGLVNVSEESGRPAVIQGVQHLLHTMSWLDQWSDEDRRTQIVFITQDIPRANLKDVIDLLDRVSSRTFKAREKWRLAREAAKTASQR